MSHKGPSMEPPTTCHPSGEEGRGRRREKGEGRERERYEGNNLQGISDPWHFPLKARDWHPFPAHVSPAQPAPRPHRESPSLSELAAGCAWLNIDLAQPLRVDTPQDRMSTPHSSAPQAFFLEKFLQSARWTGAIGKKLALLLGVPSSLGAPSYSAPDGFVIQPNHSRVHPYLCLKYLVLNILNLPPWPCLLSLPWPCLA